MSRDQPEHSQIGSGAYSAKWSSHVESPTRARIRQEVYGNEYPAEVDPRSYLTWSELRRVSRELRVGSRNTFVDLGCGQGGPSLWIARETGAALVGIDLSDIGITRARERALQLGLADRARFQAADIVATRLLEASCDGAMSVDTLWAVTDTGGALREAARILKPGARFAFTNWDRDLSPPGYPPPLSDHRPLLGQAGFEVEVYETQTGAEDKRRAYYGRVVAAEPALIEEMGYADAQKLLFEAQATLGLTGGTDYLAHSHRIFVAARKRAA